MSRVGTWCARAGLMCLLAAAALPGLAAERPDPELDLLRARLRAIDSDPARTPHAAYERLRASQAVQNAADARRRQRPLAVQVAQRRVEAAEAAVGAEIARAALQRLDTERAELLVEASRRDAERARAEAERLRIEAQIQAEEANRLRAAIEAETLARQDAEATLDSVTEVETEKLRLAREREAELARREAELKAAAGQTKPKPKPKPKPRQR